MLRKLGFLAFALLGACASAPPATRPNESGAWGYLKLVPHAGSPAATGAAHAYGDRRLEGVEWVDYSKPGFAVVVAESTPSPGGQVVVDIRDTPSGPRLDPALAALGVGGEVVVANHTSAQHILSIPAGGIVRVIPAGASESVAVTTPGEWPVFLVDVPGEETLVFAASGRYAVVSEAGRFELLDLSPGRQRLSAWHPRFPSASVDVDLPPGQASRVDIELGVDRPGAGSTDAP